MCELMMVSHMTAWENGRSVSPLAEGYFAVIQTNTCFVFQLNRDEKSGCCQSVAMRSLDLDLTSIEVEFNVSVLLSLGGVIIWPTFDPATIIRIQRSKMWSSTGILHLNVSYDWLQVG